MTNIDGSYSKLEARDDYDFECEAAKVEIGDTVVGIVDEMENGDLFIFFFIIGPCIGAKKHLKMNEGTLGTKGI
jgi:hypothetical protein